MKPVKRFTAKFIIFFLILFISINAQSDLPGILPTGALEITSESPRFVKELIKCVINGQGGNFFMTNIDGKPFAVQPLHTIPGRSVEIGALHPVYGWHYGVDPMIKIDGIVRGVYGPEGDEFVLIEMDKLFAFDNTVANDSEYFDVPTMPLKKKSIDLQNPGIFYVFGVSGEQSDVQTGKVDVFCYSYNKDALGQQNNITKVSFNDKNNLDVPAEVYNENLPNWLKGSSGSMIMHIPEEKRETLEKAEQGDINAMIELISASRIVGPLESGAFEDNILAVQSPPINDYIDQIRTDIGEPGEDALQFRIKGGAGGVEEIGNWVVQITSIQQFNFNEIFTEFRLEQNYPNPFNPSTTIAYSIPVVDVPSLPGRQTSGVEGPHVSLIVYDLLGKEIAILINKQQQPGNYQVEFDANELTSGIYFYKLTAGNFSQTRKMLLVR